MSSQEDLGALFQQFRGRRKKFFKGNCVNNIHYKQTTLQKKRNYNNNIQSTLHRWAKWGNYDNNALNSSKNDSNDCIPDTNNNTNTQREIRHSNKQH